MGRSRRVWRNVVWGVGGIGLAGFLACSPPTDWLWKTTMIRQAGEEARAKTGRQPGQVVIPPGAKRPILVPIELGDPIPFHFVPLPRGTVPSQAGKALEEPTERTVAAVALDTDRFVQFLRTRYNIGVVDVKSVNGRFAGSDNLLRVEFVPRARDEETAFRDFLFVAAAAFGMDTGRTIDRVVGLAVDLQLLPWLQLTTSLEAFERYRAGEWSLEEYRQHLEIQRY